MIKNFLFREGWAGPLFTLLGFTLAGFLLQLFLLRVVGRWVKRSKTQADNLVLESLAPHVTFWAMLAGLGLALAAAPLPPSQLELARRCASVLFLLSITFALATLAAKFVGSYGGRVGLGVAEASLSRTLARSLVIGIGFLSILSQLGISITPVLTALGVGSLAVALALQDTLANFFAGFHVIATKLVAVGDFVKLDSQQSGYVTDIGWRNCRLKELSGYAIVIPNQKLAQSIVYNYHRPEKRLAVLVNLGVAYGTDLARAEAVAVEEAKRALKQSKGAAADFEPFVRYNEFGDNSIRFTVIMQCEEFTDQYLLTHEFIKRLHSRYAEEGIVIPAPRSAVKLVDGWKGEDKEA
jgi:small-conductance mechanosensitive channel